MIHLKLRIEPFDPQTASETEWTGYFSHTEAIFAELNPDDPLPSRDLTRESLMNPQPYDEVRRWLVWEGEKAVAEGNLYFPTPARPDYDDNKHTCYTGISVQKPFRHRGVATALLKEIVSHVKARDYVTVVRSDTAMEAGHIFCKVLGGKTAISEAGNRLKLGDVDWEMVQSWVDEGVQRAPGVTLEYYERLPPEQDLEAFAALFTEVLDQQPLGDLDSATSVYTVEMWHDYMQAWDERGTVHHLMFTREADGTLSGLTNVSYNPANGHRINQILTGVREAYRGRGLAKGLKACMLLKIRELYPAVQYINTGNADANAPMLSINRRLGFTTYKTSKIYQFDAQDLARKLGL